jgi:hypothetical protein
LTEKQIASHFGVWNREKKASVTVEEAAAKAASGKKEEQPVPTVKSDNFHHLHHASSL